MVLAALVRVWRNPPKRNNPFSRYKASVNQTRRYPAMLPIRPIAALLLLAMSGAPQAWGQAPRRLPDLSTVPGVGPADLLVSQCSGSGDLAALPSEAPRGESDPLAELKQRVADLEAAEEARVGQAADEKKEAAAKPTLHWSGQLQSDFYMFDQDAASRARFGDIENGSAFRRARLGMFGEHGPTEYRIEADFALSGRPSFLNVFAGIHDLPLLGRVRVGHMFEPFSLERTTPNRFVTFMERSLPDQPFAPAFNNGVLANRTLCEDNVSVALGCFRSDSDFFGDDGGDSFENAITGRMTCLPYYANDCGYVRYAHLGVGYSVRDTNNGVARFRSQPEARIGSAAPNVPFFVDTGEIPADMFQLVGLEGAWVRGPFSLQSEYYLTPVDTTTQGTLLFHGWYATASYFLTGEHRPYNRQIGAFDRVIPKCDFVRYRGDGECRHVATGPGAWEVAARVSQLDLDDAAVRGGRLTDFTVGLNWYMSPYLRWTFDCVNANSDNVTESQTTIFGTRIGYEF